MTFGLAGSVLSKAAAASVLVPLGAAQLWPRFRSLPRSMQAIGAALGCLFGIYCITMLSRYLPAFLAIANLGPNSLAHPAWYVISRDLGCVLLAVLAWRVVDRATAVGLILGIASFLVFSFVFEVNLVCVTLVLGLCSVRQSQRRLTYPRADRVPVGASSGHPDGPCRRFQRNGLDDLSRRRGAPGHPERRPPRTEAASSASDGGLDRRCDIGDRRTWGLPVSRAAPSS